MPRTWFKWMVLLVGCQRHAAGRGAGRILQDARREVARPLDLTRQRAGERDHGSSR